MNMETFNYQEHYSYASLIDFKIYLTWCISWTIMTWCQYKLYVIWYLVESCFIVNATTSPYFLIELYNYHFSWYSIYTCSTGIIFEKNNASIEIKNQDENTLMRLIVLSLLNISWQVNHAHSWRESKSTMLLIDLICETFRCKYFIIFRTRTHQTCNW